MSNDNNMRIVPYRQGIGRYERVEVIKSGVVREFNELLEAKLSDGWRLIQDIRTIGYSNSYWFAVVAKVRK